MLLNWATHIGQWIAYTFMPLVTAYHLITSNVFLNTASEDAHGLEKWGNTALAPVHYLLAGEIAYPSSDPHLPYYFEQRFDYRCSFFIKTAGSVVVLPLSMVVGTLLKGGAFCSATVRARHRDLMRCRFAPPPPLSQERYRALGIEIEEPGLSSKSLPLGYARRPGDERHLKREKRALKLILETLKSHGIICWADCGTCLGAYRYGGVIPWDMDVDIAVLQCDFAYVKQALYSLPRSKYLVEDWSSRLHPGTLLKVYLRKTREYIDIYHFALNSEKQTVQFILSHADNFLLPRSWKIREQRFTVETPYAYVFPLRTTLFDGIELPIPHQIEKYLQQRYGENLSPAKIYDEQSEQYIKDLSHPYWKRAYAH